MSIHLVGGGWDEAYDGEVYRDFLAEATARASAGGRALPRIAVLLVREDEETVSLRAGSYTRQLTRVAECEPVVTAVLEEASSRRPCSPASTACSSAGD